MAATGVSLQLGIPTSLSSKSNGLSFANGGLFGTKTNTTATTGQIPVTSTSNFTLDSQTGQLLNFKDGMVSNEFFSLLVDLEKHIKSQKELKEVISNISLKDITSVSKEISLNEQSLTFVEKCMHREVIVIDHLKFEVGQELKNGGILQQLKDVNANYHDFSDPMKYFQHLVYSFESIIDKYRKEIEEVENFISSTVSFNQFTPQDLSDILKKHNDWFIGVASHLHKVHESVKVLKEKYSYFRRTVYNDQCDPFNTRKKSNFNSVTDNSISPAPISDVAVISAFTSKIRL